jgi:antitoxin MazE
MKTKLIKIGNSRGIRLPKALIEQVGLSENNVELLVEDDQIILRSRRRKKKHPRAGWDEAFKKALAEHGNELTAEDREWLNAPIDAEPDEWKW